MVFSLVNLANFKLHKETGANRFISGLGFLLTIIANIILVGYNFIHNPQSLMSSGLVVVGVVLFTYLYYKIENRKYLIG